MDSYSSENDLEEFPVQLAVVGITLRSNGVMSSCPDSVESHSCGDELDMSGLQPDDPALTRTCTHGVKPFNVSLAHDEFEDPAFSMILLDPMSAAIASYNAKSAVPGRRLCEDFELKLKPTANYHLVTVLVLLVRLLHQSNPLPCGDVNEWNFVDRRPGLNGSPNFAIYPSSAAPHTVSASLLT